MEGPARGRRRGVLALRAVLSCLALIAFARTSAQAQTLTPDLFRPQRDGFLTAQNSPVRKTGDKIGDPTADPTDPANDLKLRDKDRDNPAPSRIGQIPTYGLPAANGASGSGFDSLNRTRKKPKFYPGQAKPKPPPGPGSPAAAANGPAILNGRVRLWIPRGESAQQKP